MIAQKINSQTFKPGDLVERRDSFCIRNPPKRTVISQSGDMVTISQEGFYPQPVERVIPAAALIVVDNATNRAAAAICEERNHPDWPCRGVDFDVALAKAAIEAMKRNIRDVFEAGVRQGVAEMADACHPQGIYSAPHPDEAFAQALSKLKGEAPHG